MKMSFDQNDNMNTIHLGNYEEFFILYMDNELSGEQVKMVDAFLLLNPDLKAELELLMSTRLPLESLSLDKSGLFAESMKLSSVEEELLLYVDGELDAAGRQRIEAKSAGSHDYAQQLQLLMQARLDPSEKIAYPDKNELYHRTGRVISLKIWFRVAAAAVLIAVAGILYLTGGSPEKGTPPPVAARPQAPVTLPYSTPAGQPADHSAGTALAAAGQQDPGKFQRHSLGKSEGRQPQRALTPSHDDTKLALASRPSGTDPERAPERTTSVHTSPETIDTRTIVSTNLNKLVQTADVTYLPVDRPANEVTPNSPERAKGELTAKGSVKGFLRKATRMIEKRTGFDPTNENGDLLIGAVTINLK